ncbi:nucleotidyltransferase [Clostridia bacterium]|nr:nucleotidyltransferase [Clostridia bacterium]
MTQDSIRLKNHILKKRNTIYTIMEKYGATNLRIFGSVANGTATKKSDIDLMVDLKNPPHSKLMTILGLEMEVREELGDEIDVVSSEKMLPKITSGIYHSELISI